MKSTKMSRFQSSRLAPIQLLKNVQYSPEKFECANRLAITVAVTRAVLNLSYWQYIVTKYLTIRVLYRGTCSMIQHKLFKNNQLNRLVLTQTLFRTDHHTYTDYCNIWYFIIC